MCILFFVCFKHLMSYDIPIIKFMPVTGFIHKDKLTGGRIGQGLGQPIGQLTPAATKLNKCVAILQQARLVQLSQKA